jgi:putative flippase GtrA
MEAILARAVSPAQAAVLMQFLRFGTVGFCGFLVDTAVVYGTRDWLGLYGAGALSYVLAASGNWVLNRLWTFRGQGSGPMHRQWALFLATNLIGFVLNRGAYALLVTFSAVCIEYPVIAVFAGSLAGMFANFSLSRRVVFR